MFVRIKKTIRPPRKKDYVLPDGTLPEGKSWIGGGYFGRFDRARIEDECSKWVEDGRLVHVPRVWFRVELRNSIRVDGRPTPKTIKTWFIKESDFENPALRRFWKTISADLTEFGLSRSQVNRIKEKIKEAIPKA